MRIDITKESEDKLVRERWTFSVLDAFSMGLSLHFSNYIKVTRPTRRHGWKDIEAKYNSNYEDGHTMNTLTRKQAIKTIPDNAKQKVMESVVETFEFAWKDMLL